MNNKYGFIIEKLILIGKTVEPAVLNFKKGLNVIHGPSDTGKTYAYQCIEYILGKSKITKVIPEANDYEFGYLQIKTNNEEVYTIERALIGGDIRLYNIAYENILKDSKVKKYTTKALGNFLLDICNIKDKKARSNESGETKRITFRTLQNFFLLGETELTANMSPIAKNQYLDQTYLSNIFKYLVTGLDDSNVITSKDESLVKKQTNKLEFIEDLIVSTIAEIKDYTDDIANIEKQKNRLDTTIKELKNEQIEIKNIYLKSDKNRKELEEKIIRFNSRYRYLSSLIERALILEKQYDSDKKRLLSTVEACYSLKDLGNSFCPLCNNDIGDEEIDIDSIIFASLQEIKKIDVLKEELLSTISMFNTEKKELEIRIIKEKGILEDIRNTIEKEINSNLKSTSDKLTSFLEKKSLLQTALVLQKKLNEYELDKDTIIKYLKNSTKKNLNEYEKLNTIHLQTLIKRYKEILKGINFKNFENVIYSEKELDLIIDNKMRLSYGKGFKALFYSIFILSLLKVLQSKDYQIGLVIFDSPLVTYKARKDIGKNDTISDNLAQNMYNYLAQNYLDSQVIILENTIPPHNTKINEIEFTKIKSDGRYGFIPNKYN